MLKIYNYPEPEYFDQEIRKPGLSWLSTHPNAKPSKYKNYWSKCLPDLANLYKGICCYYCVFIENATGEATVDHYLPKSKYPKLTYEWSNFRYACIKANNRKGNYDDVIDPITIPSHSLFKLDFGNGEIYYDISNDIISHNVLDSTIQRLKLNNPELCNMRLEHFNSYLKDDTTLNGLKARSPFVYSEALRQGLL
ncbi:hypothetical protein B0187_01035 [Haemophilus paracuniculus]|uniref:TIGR02646 family protein n=1 Tax=Haemophilus paracuniculus TaxID=734 RepID=A0A1T0AWR9_9PAST|nr:hypothetical protein [Haemophilus paracuniculus]OOS00908.1 hypothetical protein B0187_01035 [Haemophilus paracuniculus]